MFTFNCKGKLFVAERPVVMGVINATSDSFYAGSRLTNAHLVLAKARQMQQEGAAIIDIGGQSTRPGSQRISAKAEREQVIPLISMIHEEMPEMLISIDTYYATVAAAAIEAGASLVNDISAGNFDHEMIPFVASASVPYICMHMKGMPENMQQQPHYDDLMAELLDFFSDKIAQYQEAGIRDIIIDPGFGFGKTIAHNFELLQQLSVLKILGKPLMAGLSRKSTIYKTLGITALEALNGTTVINTIALLHGALFLRVHDVKEAVETIQLVEAMKDHAITE